MMRLENSTLTASLSVDAKNDIHDLIQISKSALDQVYTSRVLQALYNKDMDSRFDHVADSGTGTFAWIFQASGVDYERQELVAEDEIKSLVTVGEREDKESAPEYDSADVVVESQTILQQTGRKFTDWLRSGTGFFYIAGKPGSGKSTLMKYLFQHHRTLELLESWAGNQPLIQAKHFFWFPGSKDQKSLRGLLCNLLFQSLKKLPELIPYVLPEAWKEAGSVTWQASNYIRVETKALRLALVRFLEKARTEFRVCFFIDGLDEFEDKDARLLHKDLVLLLQEFERVAPGQIKICVSSREHNVFHTTFSGNPSLKLQDLTRNDMSKLIRQELARYSNLGRNVNDLENKILEGADGVFLWTSMVLNSVRESLDNEYSLEYVMDQVNRTPSDIDELLDGIFNSITDQDMAYKTIAMFQLLANQGSNDIYRMDMSLFCYSFLEEYIKDTSFAIKAPSTPWTEDQIIDCVEIGRKRLVGRCKCLFEATMVDPDKHWDLRLQRIPPLGLRIVPVHRSVYEFLCSERVKRRIALRTSHFNPADAICKMALAEIKATGDLQLGITADFQFQILRLLQFANYQWEILPDYSALIDSLDDSILVTQRVQDSAGTTWTADCKFEANPWRTILFSSMSELTTEKQTVTSIFYTQCYLGAIEYVRSKYHSSPLFASEFSRVAIAYYAIRGALAPMDVRVEPLPFVKWLSQVGIIDSNVVVQHRWLQSDTYTSELIPHDMDLWTWLVINHIPWSSNRGECGYDTLGDLLENFLDQGADPLFSFKFRANASLDEKFHLIKEFSLEIVHSNSCCRHVQTLRSDGHFSWKSTSSSFRLDYNDFTKFVVQRGGKFNLTDLVDYYSPRNADKLRKLIKTRLEAQGKHDSIKTVKSQGREQRNARNEKDVQKSPIENITGALDSGKVSHNVGSTWHDRLKYNPYIQMLIGMFPLVPRSFSSSGFEDSCLE